MIHRTSVAMTRDIETEFRDRLLRADGQEDICLATYRPSTGATRRTAVIRSVIPPEQGDREVHGNATITAEYVLRAAAVAQEQGEGLVLGHSHPGGQRWQQMSGPDYDAEASYANLVRELTGLPLVGMTIAGRDGAWSARHWDTGTGSDVAPSHCENVRVVGDQLSVSWNDEIVSPPPAQRSHARSIASWGARLHRDVARRSVLVVGTGSVGLDVAVRLAATGLSNIGLLDFDGLDLRNLDRLIGVTETDVYLRRAKVDVARRIVEENATARHPRIRAWELSVCEPAGLSVALDFDVIFCCVDRPWPRAVLNALAYCDLIPVIDGGIAIDVFDDGDGMRGATWRSHVIRPGRPCMSCNAQLDLGAVAADRAGTLDDPVYIAGAAHAVGDQGQNVAVLSVSAAASLLAQFVSLNAAPGGLGDPGPIQYVLSTHTLEHLNVESRPDCLVETQLAQGDNGLRMTGEHAAADAARGERSCASSTRRVRLGRYVDDTLWWLRAMLRDWSRQRLAVSVERGRN